MSDAQFNAGVEVITWVLSKVPAIRKLDGHRGYMATACPGDQFPLDEMKTLQKRGGFEMFKDVSPQDYAYNHIKKLKEYGIVNGDGKGNFNPDEAISRRDAAIMIANALTVAGK